MQWTDDSAGFILVSYVRVIFHLTWVIYVVVVVVVVGGGGGGGGDGGGGAIIIVVVVVVIEGMFSFNY